MKKAVKRINVIIVLMLLVYIFIGSSISVYAVEVNKEEIVENTINETQLETENKESNSELNNSESLNDEEHSLESEDDVLKEESYDDNISSEESTVPVSPENEAESNSIKGEKPEDEISSEKISEESQEEAIIEEVPVEENLSQEVSQDINEDTYAYSLQKNRDLAMQIMEEELAQKEMPQLFRARALPHTTAFIEKFSPLAVKYANQKGLYPSVMLAQAILESGWGKSSLSMPPYHQLFGIKSGSFSGDIITVPTQEWVPDKSHPNGGYMITIEDQFRIYNSYSDAFIDQSNFLMKSRYTNVLRKNAPTYQHATTALSKAGYATDPDYTAKLNNIIKNYELYLYDEIPTVSYTSHVQTKGWLPEVNNGAQSGTTGQNKRMEAIKISIEDFEGLGISYSTHVQSKGWTDWVNNGNVSGTTGSGKRLEAIKIKLTGDQADAFDVYYRVHAQSHGWLNWTKNGSPSGTVGYGKRIEAIEVIVLPKGANEPIGNNLKSHYEKPESVTYATHVQKDGWKNYVKDGKTSGTTGQKKRVEAIKINLNNKIYSGGIQYKSHVQKDGWQNWVNEGNLSGTEGQAKRLEAIQVKLTGNIAEVYDVYYRVHAESLGWLGWAKNGGSAGSEGLAKQLEAIEIKLVKKGDSAPGSTSGAFIKK